MIRFRMPEDDVDLPLWEDGGLLPEGPELLAAGLGLSLALIAEIKAWGVAWNAHRRADRPGQARELARERLGRVSIVERGWGLILSL